MKPCVAKADLEVLDIDMSIKAIIFDCFGVLIVAGHVLMYQNYPQFQSEFRNLQDQSDLGKLSRQQFNEAVSKLIGLSPSEVDRQYWSINRFNQLTIDWVRDLKISGKYKIGLLSNISRDWMDVSLPVFKREKLFDEMILSGDINIIKPDPRIFKLMADRFGVLPSECVMIDDVSANIEGAKLAGMQGIVYASVDQAKAELNNLLGLTNA